MIWRPPPQKNDWYLILASEWSTTTSLFPKILSDVTVYWRTEQNRCWTRSSSDYQIRLQPRWSWAEDWGRGGKSVGDIRRLGKWPELPRSPASRPHIWNTEVDITNIRSGTETLQLSPTSSTALLSLPSLLFPSLPIMSGTGRNFETPYSNVH